MYSWNIDLIVIDIIFLEGILSDLFTFNITYIILFFFTFLKDFYDNKHFACYSF